MNCDNKNCKDTICPRKGDIRCCYNCIVFDLCKSQCEKNKADRAKTKPMENSILTS